MAKQRQPPKEDTNRPVRRIKNGSVQISIFRDEVAAESGDARSNFSLAFTKRYYDRQEGAWKSSRSLFAADVPNAIRALTRALEYIEQHDELD